MPWRSAALATALSLALAACGGDDGPDKAGYIEDFNAVDATLERTLSSLEGDLRSSNEPARIASKLEDGSKALGAAATKLDGIEPPKDAAGPHDRTVSGVRDLAATFRTGAGQARRNDLDGLVATFTSIETSPGIRKINGALDELRRKGYAVEEGN